MSDFNDRLTEAFALHNVIPDPLATKFYKTIMEADNAPEIRGNKDVPSYEKKFHDLIINHKMKELEIALKGYKQVESPWLALYNVLALKGADQKLRDAVIAQLSRLKLFMRELTDRILVSPKINTGVVKDQIDEGITWLNSAYKWDLPSYANKGKPEPDPEPELPPTGVNPPANQIPPLAADPALATQEPPPASTEPAKVEPETSTEPAAEPNDVEIVHTAGDKVMARVMGARKINGKTYKTIKYATFDGQTMAKITDSSELTAQNIHKYIHALNDSYKKKKAAVADNPEALKKLSKQYTSMYTDDNVSAYSKLAPAQPPTDNFEEYLAQMAGTSLKDGVIKALGRIMKGQSLLKAKSDPIFVAKNAQHAMSYLLSANDEVIGQMLNQYRPKLESVPIDDVIDRLSQTFSNQQKNNTNMESKLVDLSVISEVDLGKPFRNAKSALGKVSRWYNHSGRDLNAKDVRITKRLCLYDMAATQIMLNPNQFYNNYLKPAGLGPKLKLPPAKKKMQAPVTPDQARDMDKDLANDYTNRMGDQSESKPETAGMDKDLANDYSDHMGDQPEEAAKPDEPQAQPPAQEPSQVVKNLAGRITGLRKRFKLNPRLEVMIAKELPDIKPRLRILATLSVDQLVKRAQSDSKTWMKLLDDVEQLINKMDLAGIR